MILGIQLYPDIETSPVSPDGEFLRPYRTTGYNKDYSSRLDDMGITIASGLEQGEYWQLSPTITGKSVAKIYFSNKADLDDAMIRNIRTAQVVILNSTKWIGEQNPTGEVILGTSFDVNPQSRNPLGGGWIETSPQLLIDDINIIYKKKNVK